METLGEEVILAWQSSVKDFTLCYVWISQNRSSVCIHGSSKSIIRPSVLGQDRSEFILDTRFQNIPDVIKQLVAESKIISSVSSIVVNFPASINQDVVQDSPNANNVTRNVRRYDYSNIKKQGGVLRIVYPSLSAQQRREQETIGEVLLALFGTGFGSMLSLLGIGEDRARAHKKIVLGTCVCFWVSLISLGYLWYIFESFPHNKLAGFFAAFLFPTAAITYLANLTRGR